MNHFSLLGPKADLKKLRELRAAAIEVAEADERYSGLRKALAEAPDCSTRHKNFAADVVELGAAADLSANQQAQLKQCLQAFIPWRKGPFNIFGNFIDAEWQSNQKWQRIAPFLDPLEDKVICDIGCNNGYYLYRMAHQRPRLAWGIDPIARYHYNIELLQKYAQEPRVAFDLFSFTELQHCTESFDVVFNMGILYHHKNPLEILSLCFQALKKKGQLVIESLGVGGTDSSFLFPQKRYAKMRNVWFVPTEVALKNMLQRSGFTQIECHFNEVMQTDEQRSTEWAPFDSFAQFLDPDNDQLTIEGYERPRRIYLTARKP